MVEKSSSVVGWRCAMSRKARIVEDDVGRHPASSARRFAQGAQRLEQRVVTVTGPRGFAALRPRAGFTDSPT
jgi:hypothetical protein